MMFNHIEDDGCGRSSKKQRNGAQEKRDTILQNCTEERADASFIELYSECEKEEEKKDD